LNADAAKASKHIVCVGSEEHRFLVSDAIEAANLTLGPSADLVDKTVLLEPMGRNTAAAMALAALAVKSSAGLDDLLLFCPADHHIPDTRAFIDSVKEGVEAANKGAIVTFGVVPSFPSTAYGYIDQGAKRQDGSRSVKRFIEKPNASKAQELLLQGDVLWNAGIFLVSVSTLLRALDQHACDILVSGEAAMLEA
jgi:mannose-1-phosphate guanylyltransferase/mannose-6-phosphate isomerase